MELGSQSFDLAALLFDSEYYYSSFPTGTDLPSEPLKHFLSYGTAEKKNPHPLFDTAFYLQNNPDVAELGLNPLVHYVAWGFRELRNPHPLFDAAFYDSQHPEVRVNGENPLVHFLEHGTYSGFNPNSLFDIEFYLEENPDVLDSGMNPLIHYIEHGAGEGRDPHPLFGTRNYLERYPDVARTCMNPLAHYFEYGQKQGRAFSRPIFLVNKGGSAMPREAVVSAEVTSRLLKVQEAIPVFCVYGTSNLEFLQDLVIPAFSNANHSLSTELHFVNYRAKEALIGSHTAKNGLVVRDWSDSRPPGHLGFGEGINYLFSVVRPSECFFLCNPDSFPMEGCLQRLVDTYIREKPAIVEARQWPSPHPKEFDSQTLETPWASGAFSLISADAFKVLGGFDPIYFLYLEDVDLSWRAWLRGLRVLHEPSALCAHSTGLHFYQTNRFYYEHYFSLRNFLIISYKFFGKSGERAALALLASALLPTALHKKILASYFSMRESIRLHVDGCQNIEKIKILGLNLFHELRQ